MADEQTQKEIIDEEASQEETSQKEASQKEASQENNPFAETLFGEGGLDLKTLPVVFEYNNKPLFDNAELGYGLDDIEAVRAFYAEYDRSLVVATYTVVPPEKKGEPVKVVYAKETGTKGLHPDIALLMKIPPALVDEFALLSQVPTFSEVELVDKVDDIEAAWHTITHVARETKEVLKRCINLKAVPFPNRPPPGF